MLPEGWDLFYFGEIAKVGSGQVDPKQEPYASMIHIGPENIESGTGRIVSPQRCSDLGLISGKYEFDEKAVIYSKIRPHLNCAGKTFATSRFHCLQKMSSVRLRMC